MQIANPWSQFDGWAGDFPGLVLVRACRHGSCLVVFRSFFGKKSDKWEEVQCVDGRKRRSATSLWMEGLRKEFVNFC